MLINRTAVLAAVLVLAGTAEAAGFPTPQWNAAEHVSGGRVSVVGVFDLDPHRTCVKFDYSSDPNVEPDLGPAGSDSCGAPDQVTVSLRLYEGRRLVFSATRVTPVRGYRGRWTLTVPCRGDRWAATLVNPWQGTNRTVAGSLRCR